MSEVNFRGEIEEPFFLNFSASRPPGGARFERASGAAAGEERPLYLDPATGEPWRGPAGEPAARYRARATRPVRGAGSRRVLLAAGLTVVVGLSVAVALWSYPAVERRIASGEGAPAGPAPSAALAAGPAPAAAAQPVAAIQEETKPAQPGPAAIAPAPPPRQELVTEPAPEVVEPRRQEPRPEPPPARRARRTSARAEAKAATARANMMETYAPQSTLSAQLAAQTGAPTGAQRGAIGD